MGWGLLRIGRMEVAENYTASEQHNAGTGERTVQLTGQSFTSWRGYDNNAVVRAQEDIMGLAGTITAVVFEDKPEHSGYYQVKDVGAEILHWPDDSIRSFNWGFILEKFGPDNAVDVEARVGTIVRANNFALTGERWQAPPIGHYAYYTGSSAPAGTVSRTGSDGAITVYRSIPAAVNPRYGCPVGSYWAGRARVLVDGYERTGISIRAAATTWELNNGLVRVRPLTAAGMLSVDSWGGSAWETKSWHIAKGGATTSLGTFDQATIIRNDFEMVTLRLVRNGTPGRTYVDLTLRRGSRFVECFIQTDSSATLGAYLETVETASDQTASGYVVANANDADGNKYIVGSSKTVTYTANRGISKAAVTQLDVYIGSVVNGTGAAAGDAATDLRNQYIGAVSESTTVVKR